MAGVLSVSKEGFIERVAQRDGGSREQRYGYTSDPYRGVLLTNRDFALIILRPLAAGMIDNFQDRQGEVKLSTSPSQQSKC